MILCRHTHGQVDQIFSCHSRYLHRTKALTVNDLCDSLRTSYSTLKEGRVQVEVLEDTADVQSWLKPVAAHVNNITGAQQYLFEGKWIDGQWKAIMSCKQFAACGDDKLHVVGPLLKV